MSAMDRYYEKIDKLPGADDPFDIRYGPTPEKCFSSNDIERMFRLGALAADVQHLTECDFCRERQQNYAAARVANAAAVSIRHDAPRWMPAWMRGLVGSPQRITPDLPTVVFIPQPLEINIAYATATDPLRVQLVTNREALQGARVCLQGPLESTERFVGVGGWVEFPEVKVSHDVMDALSRHNRITEQVTIRAEGGEGQVRVIGASNIELRRG